SLFARIDGIENFAARFSAPYDASEMLNLLCRIRWEVRNSLYIQCAHLFRLLTTVVRPFGEKPTDRALIYAESLGNFTLGHTALHQRDNQEPLDLFHRFHQLAHLLVHGTIPSSWSLS